MGTLKLYIFGLSLVPLAERMHIMSFGRLNIWCTTVFLFKTGCADVHSESPNGPHAMTTHMVRETKLFEAQACACALPPPLSW